MRIKSRIRWYQIAVALVAVTWTGCATTSGIKPFDLASHRDQAVDNVAAPSQLATPEQADAPSADGYQTQFVSAPRPQRRYTAPACTSGFS